MKIQVGEIREVGIEVISRLNQEFVIDAAEYQIIKKDGTEVEKSIPTINGHKLLILFNATEKGLFYVIFKYHIGPEILKAKVLVEVV